MTVEEFNELSVDDKIEMISRIGNYVDGIVYYGHPANLYSIANYFVEVRLTKDSGDIDQVRIIEGRDLEKYLNRIQIPF